MPDVSESVMTLGEELELSVYALAYGGEGIAKHKGLIVFVPGTLPGDRVRAQVVHVKKRFARAEVIERLADAPERITPACIHAGVCGGCSWQHLAYPAQLKAKQAFVEKAFQHIGRLRDVAVAPVVKAVPQNGYRHKIQLPFQDAPGGFVAGFYARQTHQVVPIETCPVQPGLGNRIFRSVRELANQFHYSGYREDSHQGQLRHLVIRLGLNTAEALVVLVTTDTELPRLQEFAAELHVKIPELVGVVHNVNPAVTNVILGSQFRVLSGRPFFYEEIQGFRYRISAGSFFQVNPHQLPALAETVVQAAGLTGRETVVDLFCGVGFLTFELARKARLVLGIESIASAVEDAQANKHLNQISHVDFSLQDSTAGVERLRAKGFMPDVVVLDPPRKGCEPVLLKKIRAWKPKRIVYVSCNPVTLARDAALLSEGAYHLENPIRPIDLFPHTYHVESVAVFARKQ